VGRIQPARRCYGSALPNYAGEEIGQSTPIRISSLQGCGGEIQRPAEGNMVSQGPVFAIRELSHASAFFCGGRFQPSVINKISRIDICGGGNRPTTPAAKGEPRFSLYSPGGFRQFES
jgi:hypothetical protein